MARFPEGAQCISDMMQDVQVFQPLVELLTGRNLIEYKPDVSQIASPESDISSSDSNVFSSLEGTSPESAKATTPGVDMTRIDRENAVVLVSELLKNRGSEMALMRRTLFEDLLKGGGDLILSYRESMARNAPAPKERRARGGYNVQDVTVQSFNELS